MHIIIQVKVDIRHIRVHVILHLQRMICLSGDLLRREALPVPQDTQNG